MIELGLPQLSASDYADFTNLFLTSRFSISKLPAFTLSHFPTAHSADKSSLLDRRVDSAAVARRARLVGEALACSVYADRNKCSGDLMQGALDPEQAGGVDMWTEEFSR